MNAVSRPALAALPYTLKTKCSSGKRVRFATPLAVPLGDSALSIHLARVNIAAAARYGDPAWHGLVARHMAFGTLQSTQRDSTHEPFAVAARGLPVRARMSNARLYPAPHTPMQTWRAQAIKLNFNYADWGPHGIALGLAWLAGRYGDEGRSSLAVMILVVALQGHAVCMTRNMRAGALAGVVAGLCWGTGFALRCGLTSRGTLGQA